MKKILLGLTAVFALSVAVPAVAVANKTKAPAKEGEHKPADKKEDKKEEKKDK